MYRNDLHDDLVTEAASGPLYLGQGATDGVDRNAYLR